MSELSAAIAQSVERILGKDEVASSNLASSSKIEPIPLGIGSFLFADKPDLNHLNATVRGTVAGRVGPRPLYMLSQRHSSNKSG